MQVKYGPKLPISEEIHATKYRLAGEPFTDCCARIASTLSDDSQHRYALLDIFQDMRFMPAGRVQAAIGAPKRVTPWNCLSGDTKIVTKEFGLTRLDNPFVAGREVTILDGNQEWIKVPVIKHGRQNTFKVLLTNQKQALEIYATEDHNWLLSDGSVVQTKALKPGKRIPLNIPKISLNSEEYRKGVIHGLVYGDGAATNDNGFQLRVCAGHNSLVSYLEGIPNSKPPLMVIRYTIFTERMSGQTIKTFRLSLLLNIFMDLSRDGLRQMGVSQLSLK